MACKHNEDTTWKPDLLWKYTHTVLNDPKQVQLEDTPYTRSWFDKWHGIPDSKNAQHDRHKVYELLLDEPAPANWRNSALPWNQENPRFRKRMEKGGFRGLFCGAAVKIFLAKYMKYVDYPKRTLVHDNDKIRTACKLIRDSLADGKGVIVGLGHPERHAVSHYVGIIGHRQVVSGKDRLDHFLFLEPYGDPAWGSVTYGWCADGSRGKTSFLGEFEHDTDQKALVYIGKAAVDYIVMTY